MFWSPLNRQLSVLLLPRTEAEPSKDSFLRLLTKTKVVLICYVIFTLSAGLGFLDATLSLFAIDTVKIPCSEDLLTVSVPRVTLPPSLSWCSSVSLPATWGSSCWVCPYRTVWPHRCWATSLTNTP